MACGHLRIPALIEMDYSPKPPINAESVSAPESKATGNSAARMPEITIEGKVTPPARQQTDKERYRLLQNHGEHYERKNRQEINLANSEDALKYLLSIQGQ